MPIRKPSLFRAAVAAGTLALLAACAPAMETTRGVTESFPNPLAVITSPFAPPDEPKALIGHSGREVAGWLGEPHLKRRDPPAQMWQYRSPSCVLDFFLYARPGGDDLAHEVSHVEIRPREANARACLSAIRASGRRASGG